MPWAFVKDGVIDTISLQPVDGWVEVPEGVFAGHTQQGDTWAAPVVADPPQSVLDEQDTLTPPRFRYMLAANGWVDVWNDVEAWAKANDTATFAALYAQKGSEFYRLSVTFAFLEQVRPLVAQLHPDVDVSEATVRAAWAAAKKVSLTLGS